MLADRGLAELPSSVRARVTCMSIRQFAEARDSEFILFGRNPEFSSLCQLRRACEQQAPVCCLVHSILSPNAVANYLGLLCQAEYYDRIIVTSAAARTAFLSMCDQTIELAAERGLIGTDKVWERPEVVTIPLGVDDALLEPVDKGQSRRVLNIPSEANVVLYLGRLSEDYKADLEVIFRSIQQISASGTDVMLVIAGNQTDNGYVSRLESLARELRIREQTRFVNNFAPYMKRLLYSASDIFVSPADNIQESYGISIVEAMATGLPIVASNWSGYRDLVHDGVNGFLIDTWVDPAVFKQASMLAA